MEAANRRRNARNVLAQMEAQAAAFAAVMSKSGKQPFEKLQSALVETADI